MNCKLNFGENELFKRDIITSRGDHSLFVWEIPSRPSEYHQFSIFWLIPLSRCLCEAENLHSVRQQQKDRRTHILLPHTPAPYTHFCTCPPILVCPTLLSSRFPEATEAAPHEDKSLQPEFKSSGNFKCCTFFVFPWWGQLLLELNDYPCRAQLLARLNIKRCLAETHCLWMKTFWRNAHCYRCPDYAHLSASLIALC